MAGVQGSGGRRAARWAERRTPRRSTGAVASLAFALVGLAAVALAAPGSTAAANPTLSPFVDGRHVYDYSGTLSAKAAARAETLATHIEASGGGRVVIYVGATNGASPGQDALVAAWQIDGIVISGGPDSLYAAFEPKIKTKLTSKQVTYLKNNTTAGPATEESWVTSTLARADAFINGKYVMDGAGALDSSGMQQAETKVAQMADWLGGPVYVDIAMGGDDPSTTAFFNGASMASDLGAKMVVALAVTNNEIGGYIDADSDVWGNYDTAAPWSNSTMENTGAHNGDIGAAIIADISAITKPPMIPPDLVPWLIFAAVVVVLSIAVPFVGGPWLMRRMSGVSSAPKDAVAGIAVIEGISDTGVTVTMPSVGPDAPDLKLDLAVTPANGAPAYRATTKALIPRIFVPQIVPGARIGVLIDPRDPQKVTVDFAHFNAGAADFAATLSDAAAAGAPAGDGTEIDFDASGNPNMAQVGAMLHAANSGTLPLIRGSAAELLATGTHGTAVITSAQPMGRKVRDINPKAEPSRLDDPMWLFTLEVSLAGRNPFPAVLGHRVPIAKVAEVAPGVRLAVAVGAADPTHDVAIDWDKSPIQ
jgi:hypothetical protein